MCAARALKKHQKTDSRSGFRTFLEGWFSSTYQPFQVFCLSVGILLLILLINKSDSAENYLTSNSISSETMLSLKSNWQNCEWSYPFVSESLKTGKTLPTATGSGPPTGNGCLSVSTGLSQARTSTTGKPRNGFPSSKETPHSFLKTRESHTRTSE